MFKQVKQEIDNEIKTNGNNEITAARLNGVLQDMMDAAAEEIENVAESVGDQVEANPTEEATATLNTIKIGETNYNIPQTDTSDLVTKQELQQDLSGKQDTINDLSDIRSGASSGATAVQPSTLNGYVQKSQTTGLLKNDGTVDTQTAGKAASALQPKQSGQYTQGNIVIFDANGGLADSQKNNSDFATAAQGEKANTALQPNGVKTINNQSIVGSGNITIEGQQGEQGDSAYLHIMYSRNMPESDSDISSTFEAGYRYIGICTDNNQTAPSTYESYQWAKFVGNDGGGGGLTTEERAAIVALFKAAVYTSGTGIDDLIDIIENPPITKTVVGITVTVPSPQPNVCAGQNLDDVKPYLTVTASYDDNTSAVVTAYTLSGDISTTGTKQITASYTENGVTVTDTFDLVVSVAPTLYQVTNNLTNCTSNGSLSVYEHNSYNAVISPVNGYTLTEASVTVTMGGNNITSTSYSNGVVNIADVTGNIVITISAAAKILTGITAVLDEQTPNFSTGDSLDVVKPYLTVTAQYSNAPDDTLTDTDYTLSSNDGDTLITGTNTIIVTYQSQTDSVSVTAVAAPVFFNKINLQGGAYIETDLMLPQNFSMLLACDNANIGSTQGYGIIGCSGATSGKFELNRNSWGNSFSKNYYYYGTDNYTGSLQLNTTDYPSWTPWMTPNKYGNGGATKTYTKGAGTPNGVLVVGKTSHANKYQGFFYASINGCCIKILGDYAQDAAGYEDLLSMAALYTLKPCVYNNEHGLWCVENNTFYGNTASVGTITCSNNE